MKKHWILEKVDWEIGSGAPGFTMVEILVALVVSSVVMAAVYTSYEIQTKASTAQRELARMEGNLRGAMYLIKSDIRNAGRNSDMLGKLPLNGMRAIEESRRYNQNDFEALDNTPEDGYPGINLWTVIEWLDTAAGETVRTGFADASRQQNYRRIRYRLWDSDGNGVRELHRFYENFNGNTVYPNRNTMVADGIENIGFAFAYDIDNDGDIERAAPLAAAPPGSVGPIIWAADTDDTPGLDTNLDSNTTNTIDEDDAGLDGMIDVADGGLGFQMTQMERIRAVRIWILARSINPIPGFIDTGTYQVGARTIQPARAAGEPGHPVNVRRLLMTSAVHMRNRERVDDNE